jgi:adenylosuccinate lyase
MMAGNEIKTKGGENRLLQMIAEDDMFPVDEETLKDAMRPEKYIGRAKEQTEKFLDTVVKPVLKNNEAILGLKTEINV